MALWAPVGRHLGGMITSMLSQLPGAQMLLLAAAFSTHHVSRMLLFQGVINALCPQGTKGAGHSIINGAYVLLLHGTAA